MVVQSLVMYFILLAVIQSSDVGCAGLEKKAFDSDVRLEPPTRLARWRCNAKVTNGSCVIYRIDSHTLCYLDRSENVYKSCSAVCNDVELGSIAELDCDNICPGYLKFSCTGYTANDDEDSHPSVKVTQRSVLLIIYSVAAFLVVGIFTFGVFLCYKTKGSGRQHTCVEAPIILHDRQRSHILLGSTSFCDSPYTLNPSAHLVDAETENLPIPTLSSVDDNHHNGSAASMTSLQGKGAMLKTSPRKSRPHQPPCGLAPARSVPSMMEPPTHTIIQDVRRAHSLGLLQGGETSSVCRVQLKYPVEAQRELMLLNQTPQDQTESRTLSEPVLIANPTDNEDAGLSGSMQSLVMEAAEESVPHNVDKVV